MNSSSGPHLSNSSGSYHPIVSSGNASVSHFNSYRYRSIGENSSTAPPFNSTRAPLHYSSTGWSSAPMSHISGPLAPRHFPSVSASNASVSYFNSSIDSHYHPWTTMNYSSFSHIQGPGRPQYYPNATGNNSFMPHLNRSNAPSCYPDVRMGSSPLSHLHGPRNPRYYFNVRGMSSIVTNFNCSGSFHSDYSRSSAPVSHNNGPLDPYHNPNVSVGTSSLPQFGGPGNPRFYPDTSGSNSSVSHFNRSQEPSNYLNGCICTCFPSPQLAPAYYPNTTENNSSLSRLHGVGTAPYHLSASGASSASSSFNTPELHTLSWIAEGSSAQEPHVNSSRFPIAPHHHHRNINYGRYAEVQMENVLVASQVQSPSYAVPVNRQNSAIQHPEYVQLRHNLNSNSEGISHFSHFAIAQESDSVPNGTGLSELTAQQRSDLRLTFPCETPMTPSMRLTRDRVNTFNNWHFTTATPQMLAEAGFFSQGIPNQVNCFYCNGGLMNWLPEDDPWEAHAQWYPSCEFLLQQRGPEYIHAIGARFSNISQTLLPASGQTEPPVLSHSQNQELVERNFFDPAMPLPRCRDEQSQSSSLLESAEVTNTARNLRKLEDELNCKICMDDRADIVFMPCKHLCCCVKCYQKLTECPICRKRVVKAVNIFRC